MNQKTTRKKNLLAQTHSKEMFLSVLFIECKSLPEKRCQVGKFYSTIERDCIKCNRECQDCIDDQSNCIGCKPGHFILPHLHSPNFNSCNANCDQHESRIKGQHYFKCSKNMNDDKCDDGSYLNNYDRDPGFCKRCHPNCGTCDGPNENDCRSCLEGEYQISGQKYTHLKFKCSKNCENSIHSEISGKNYHFCGTSNEPVQQREAAAIPYRKSMAADAPTQIDPKFEGPNNTSFDWLHIVCFIIISNIIVAFFIFLFFKLRKKKEMSTLYSTQKDLLQAEGGEQVEEIQMITKDRIIMGKLLGQGAFGKVNSCTFTNSDNKIIHAAVKIICPSNAADVETEKRRIFKELQSMTLPRHPYVIRLLGINMADDLMLIMPLRRKDLKRYLACSRIPVPMNRLARYCAQIADGMMHLHGHNVFHCDLKAGNVLVKDEFHIEISDFGLACPSIEERGKYRGGTYTHTALELLIPCKTKAFTPECDVWSYGVTVWEIFTVGKATPYETEGLAGKKIIEYLSNGGRLKKPELLKSDVWPTVLQCFSKAPTIRPKFNRLFNIFTQLANDRSPVVDASTMIRI